jgi:hypothetical protein
VVEDLPHPAGEQRQEALKCTQIGHVTQSPQVAFHVGGDVLIEEHGRRDFLRSLSGVCAFEDLGFDVRDIETGPRQFALGQCRQGHVGGAARQRLTNLVSQQQILRTGYYGLWEPVFRWE